MASARVSEDLHVNPSPFDHGGLGIGCVGAGFIMTDCHLPAYRAAGFNVVGITSRGSRSADEAASRHQLGTVYPDLDALLADERVDIVDLAIPPHRMLDAIEQICAAPRRPRGVLAQKPLGANLSQAIRAVEACEQAGVVLSVNQNMRYDQSIRACQTLLNRGHLGEPVLATIDMRAIPHWMPWQAEQGWCTLRIMSIHHLDTYRYLFGDPDRIFASTRPDPRTGFPHTDGICLYILEYDSGLRCSSWDDVWSGPAREGAMEDKYIRWRVEGTRGLATGTIGWPDYPAGSPSTVRFTTLDEPGRWFEPSWPERWFPDAFAGTMGQLLAAVHRGEQPLITGRDNLRTMALVEAAYRSAERHCAVCPADLLG